ncbi:hypothetical protein [Streptomyces megasporus]|uniref:hypothetical protein n=1 Tax=Streptomyces megasporus TaxID=44060 RepID=UPI000A73727A|nr:hypothetical protein [Streptomyces megasporus]
MTTTATRSDHPPIYGSLIEERGDVLAETREVAERIQRETREALDWRGLGTSQFQPE